MVDVAFLSLSTDSSADELIKLINSNPELKCVFVKLTHQDLQLFQVRDTYDAVVLLHSISQGRNSITDVLDAKYNKLLPQLKQKYGPNRVAVIVHSLPSFNPDSKSALMMVFKMSQPTTFVCSECVMQCNSLSDIPGDDLERLIKFLKAAPNHPLPTPEVEAPLSTTVSGAAEPEQLPESNPTTSVNESSDSEFDENYLNRSDLGLGSGAETIKSGSSSMSSETVKEVQPTNISGLGHSESGPTYSVADCSPVTNPVVNTEEKATEYMKRLGDIQPSSSAQHMDPLSSYPSDDKSPCGVNSGPSGLPTETAFSQSGDTSTYSSRHSETQDGATGYASNKGSNWEYSSAGLAHSTSPVVQRVTEKHPYPIETINNTYPIALVVPRLFNSEESVRSDVQRCFPKKLIVPMTDLQKLNCNWHLFEAILIDVGTMRSQDQRMVYDLVSACLKSTYEQKNVALLESTAAKPHPTGDKRAHHQPDSMSQLTVFHYDCVTGRFDDATVKHIVSWLSSCYQRYFLYVKSQPSSWFEKAKKKFFSVFRINITRR